MLFLFKWGYLEGNNPFHKKIPYIQTPGLQTTNSPIVKTNVARFGKKNAGEFNQRGQHLSLFQIVLD